MGEFFTSFEDAWEAFLARTAPLERFWDEFPDDPTFVIEGWLIVPPVDLKRELLRVQSELELPGLRVVPHHFLHVWLRGGHGPPLRDLLDLPPFELHLPRLNCFHTAVVAEVEAPELTALDAPDVFLPHLSLAYVERAIDPEPVRDVVVRLRDAELGSFLVEELVRVLVPASRTTVLQPWEVAERARLQR